MVRTGRKRIGKHPDEFRNSDGQQSKHATRKIQSSIEESKGSTWSRLPAGRDEEESSIRGGGGGPSWRGLAPVVLRLWRSPWERVVSSISGEVRFRKRKKPVLMRGGNTTLLKSIGYRIKKKRYY